MSWAACSSPNRWAKALYIVRVIEYAGHPALVERARAWAEQHGVGSGASRLVTGNLDLFAGLEAKVAALKRKPAALIMASGFQANASILQALFDRSVLGAEPLVFSDRLNHASIHFGCAASGARGMAAA